MGKPQGIVLVPVDLFPSYLEGTREGMSFQILSFQNLELESHDEKFTLRGAMAIGQSSGSPRPVYRKGTKRINFLVIPASHLLMAYLYSP